MEKEELHDYFSKIGKKGGKNRWKGISKEERKKHAQMMAAASHKKDTPQQ